jgi:hypothetical protein
MGEALDVSWIDLVGRGAGVDFGRGRIDRGRCIWIGHEVLGG